MGTINLPSIDSALVKVKLKFNSRVQDRKLNLYLPPIIYRKGVIRSKEVNDLINSRKTKWDDNAISKMKHVGYIEQTGAGSGGAFITKCGQFTLKLNVPASSAISAATSYPVLTLPATRLKHRQWRASTLGSNS